jgi:hypothetical protein
MDNRKFSRILFSSKARVIQDGHTYDTELLDLSLKGALLQRPANWQPAIGDTALLQVVLNDSELQLDMEVSVAHIHDNSLGLRCERIDIESASHLRRLLELNLGDADLLSRELSELSN